MLASASASVPRSFHCVRSIAAFSGTCVVPGSTSRNSPLRPRSLRTMPVSACGSRPSPLKFVIATGMRFAPAPVISTVSWAWANCATSSRLAAISRNALNIASFRLNVFGVRLTAPAAGR